MKVFLDTSVLLAAALTREGPARELFRQARRRRWTLLTSHWCLEEVRRNLGVKYPEAMPAWRGLRRRLRVVPNALVLDRPLVFDVAKDKPVLISALASGSAALLTYDRADFQDRLGTSFYGMRLVLPRDFLRTP